MRRALRALTTLPVPAGPVPQTMGHAHRGERWSVALFPVVGLLIGLVWGLSSRVVDLYHPTTVAAALVLLADFVVTGGRPLTGVARAADRLDGSRPEDLGPVGAAAMLLITLLRFGVLVFAVDHPGVLVAVPVAGCAGMALLLSLAPDGLSGRLGPFAAPGMAPVAIAVVLGLAGPVAFAGPRAGAAAALGLLTAVLLGLWVRRREEHWTSELVYGGAILVETVALLATVAVR